MLLVVHWQDHLCWFSYIYVGILTTGGSCTQNAFTKKVLLQLQGHSSLSQPQPECPECHLSLYHRANVLIYVCNCLGTRFSPMWEIAWFYRKKKTFWIEINNKSKSLWNRGVGYEYWIRMKGAHSTVNGFLFPILISSYPYSGLWQPAVKVLLMVPVMERDKKN